MIISSYKVRYLLIGSLLLWISGHLSAQLPGPVAGSTGTVGFRYGGDSVTYAAVRAADGHIWLQQNLGATHVADSLTDTAAFGHLFQWGRWDDGHQLRNSMKALTSMLPGPKDPSSLGTGIPYFYYGEPWWWQPGTPADTWSKHPPGSANGKDPCAAIGDGWRIPIREEWENLISAENITTPASAFNSNLKLTLAGGRSHGYNPPGELYPDPSIGFYWSSTCQQQNPYLADALYISSYLPVSMYPEIRGGGYSVRCIKTCSSIITELQDSFCHNESYQLPSGKTVTDPGTYADTVILPGGCDSITRITLRVTEVNTSLYISADTLMANADDAHYRWMDCITGEWLEQGDDKFFIPGKSGRYAVVITQGGCTDTSECTDFVSLGLSVPEKEVISVYPNPAHSYVQVLGAVPLEITISSMEGKVQAVRQTAGRIGLEDLPAGMYLLRVRDEQGHVLRIEKLIKTEH